MKLTKVFLLGLAAGALALNLAACSESASKRAELVNQSLAASGTAYTVQSFDSNAGETVSLIKEAASTYANYKRSLVNINDLAKQLKDDNYAPSDGHYRSEMNRAKASNLQTRDNFAESLASFNARGIGAAYEITSAEVPEGLENEDAVAKYVATLVKGNAKVYISDVIPLPVLDDDEGAYTGNCTYLRYAYIEYTDAQ